jgi:hypothetical protein
VKIDALREMRRLQGVRVANASRGARDREMLIYRQLEARIRREEIERGESVEASRGNVPHPEG